MIFLTLWALGSAGCFVAVVVMLRAMREFPGTAGLAIPLAALGVFPPPVNLLALAGAVWIIRQDRKGR